jgi:hypothetical protein
VSVDAATTLATGRIVDASGVPVAGADIVAYAFPSAATMSSLKNPGDSFELTPVGATTSDKAGQFSLRPDYTQLASQKRTTAAEPVNIEILVDATDGWSAYSTTLRFDATGHATLDVAKDVNAAMAGVAAMAPKTKASDAAGVLTLDVALTPGALEREAVAVSDGAVIPASYSPPSNCTLQQNYGARWASVGEMASTVGGYSGKFEYISGSSSDIGYAVSATGAFGSWTLSGTQSRSSSTTVSFPTYTTAASNLMFKQWTFGKLRCVQVTNGSIFYNVVPMDYVSGAKSSSNAAPTGSYCASFAPNTGFTKSTTNAVTWTNGVDTQGIIGLALSIKTGFSSTAKLTYTFSTQRSLCGWQDYPPGTPYRLVVH